MSLYRLQKLLFELNRDPALAAAYCADRYAVLAHYHLSDEELEAMRSDDIGRLYVLGVNGQILMHYAASRGLKWDEYIQAMKDGVDRYGPVRGDPYFAIDGSAP